MHAHVGVPNLYSLALRASWDQKRENWVHSVHFLKCVPSPHRYCLFGMVGFGFFNLLILFCVVVVVVKTDSHYVTLSGLELFID